MGEKGVEIFAARLAGWVRSADRAMVNGGFAICEAGDFAAVREHGSH